MTDTEPDTAVVSMDVDSNASSASHEVTPSVDNNKGNSNNSNNHPHHHNHHQQQQNGTRGNTTDSNATNNSGDNNDTAVSSHQNNGGTASVRRDDQDVPSHGSEPPRQHTTTPPATTTGIRAKLGSADTTLLREVMSAHDAESFISQVRRSLGKFEARCSKLGQAALIGQRHLSQQLSRVQSRFEEVDARIQATEQELTGYQQQREASDQAVADRIAALQALHERVRGLKSTAKALGAQRRVLETRAEARRKYKDDPPSQLFAAWLQVGGSAGGDRGSSTHRVTGTDNPQAQTGRQDQGQDQGDHTGVHSDHGEDAKTHRTHSSSQGDDSQMAGPDAHVDTNPCTSSLGGGSSQPVPTPSAPPSGTVVRADPAGTGSHTQDSQPEAAPRRTRARSVSFASLHSSAQHSLGLGPGGLPVGWLPSSVVDRIFSFLTPTDLVRCMRTCKAWRRHLLRSSQVWREQALCARRDLARDLQEARRVSVEGGFTLGPVHVHAAACQEWGMAWGRGELRLHGWPGVCGGVRCLRCGGQRGRGAHPSTPDHKQLQEKGGVSLHSREHKTRSSPSPTHQHKTSTPTPLTGGSQSPTPPPHSSDETGTQRASASDRSLAGGREQVDSTDGDTPHPDRLSSFFKTHTTAGSSARHLSCRGCRNPLDPYGWTAMQRHGHHRHYHLTVAPVPKSDSCTIQVSLSVHQNARCLPKAREAAWQESLSPAGGAVGGVRAGAPPVHTHSVSRSRRARSVFHSSHKALAHARSHSPRTADAPTAGFRLRADSTVAANSSTAGVSLPVSAMQTRRWALQLYSAAQNGLCSHSFAPCDSARAAESGTRAELAAMLHADGMEGGWVCASSESASQYTSTATSSSTTTTNNNNNNDNNNNNNNSSNNSNNATTPPSSSSNTPSKSGGKPSTSNKHATRLTARAHTLHLCSLCTRGFELEEAFCADLFSVRREMHLLDEETALVMEQVEELKQRKRTMASEVQDMQAEFDGLETRNQREFTLLGSEESTLRSLRSQTAHLRLEASQTTARTAEFESSSQRLLQEKHDGLDQAQRNAQAEEQDFERLMARREALQDKLHEAMREMQAVTHEHSQYQRKIARLMEEMRRWKSIVREMQ